MDVDTVEPGREAVDRDDDAHAPEATLAEQDVTDRVAGGVDEGPPGVPITPGTGRHAVAISKARTCAGRDGGDFDGWLP